MVRKLYQKINLDEKYIENRTIFLYNGVSITLDSYSILEDLNLRFKSRIIVYDDDNVIGTLIIVIYFRLIIIFIIRLLFNKNNANINYI